MNEYLRQRWHTSVACLAYEPYELQNSQLDPQTPSPWDGDHALANANAVSSLSSKWLDKIETLYNEPHRAYHNMTHIKDVLSSLDVLLLGTPQQNASADMSILALAAFFHDVIYNPKSSTNEKDSADLFLEFASELSNLMILSSSSSLGKKPKPNANIRNSMDEQQQSSSESKEATPSAKKSHMTHLIEQCIIATATHISSANQARQNKNNNNDNTTTLLAVFLDADMSILGRGANRYDQYAGCIRREYEFVPRDVYCEKRAEILESFLPLAKEEESVDTTTTVTTTTKTSVPESSSSSNNNNGKEKQHLYIYATEKGRELWEDQARQNLKREIGMLQQGIIPCEEEE